MSTIKKPRSGLGKESHSWPQSLKIFEKNDKKFIKQEKKNVRKRMNKTKQTTNRQTNKHTLG